MAGQAGRQPTTVDEAADALAGSDLMDTILNQRPENEPVDDEQPDEEEDEAEDGDEEEEGESDDEPDDSDEDPEDADDEEDEPDPDEETEPLETIADLAEALETSEDDLKRSLKITVTVDGKQETVTLSELQAGYQKDADYRKKTTEVAEERRALEAERQANYQAVEQHHQIAAQTLLLAENQIVGDLHQLNQSGLRETDPAEWAARHQDLIQRQNHLKSQKEQAAYAYQEHQRQAQQQVQQATQQRLQKEAELLRNAVPDFESKKAGIENYLKSAFGFTPEELGMVQDHRLILMALKAMERDNQSQKADVAKKKIRKIPKVQKAAKQTAPVNPAKAARAKAKQRLKKSGHINDAAKAIETLL